MNAAGIRVEKSQGNTITRYIRDASGNVMAVYQADTILERPIYGSSRLGNLTYASKPGYRTVGHKQYELSNHLGNVLAVVSDRIRMRTDSTWTQVLSRTDYYPFGLEMTGRTESAGYRYGFNGKEKDPSGQWSNQSHYDYGFRIYNPTIGKFLSVDPLTREFPWNSTYAFAEGSPMANIDLDGLEKYDYRLHHAKASGQTQVALATYAFDWFTDKLIGGPVRAIQGGFEYANNERQFKNRHDNPEQVIPEEIASVNYRARQFESGAKVIKGFSDQLEFNSAMMGLAMGGLESAAASQLGKNSLRAIDPSSLARSWQGKGNYPGIDSWRNITLKEGSQVVGGLPGQSNYYTTLRGLDRSGFSINSFSEGLQISKHPEFGYRGKVGIYELIDNTGAAFGTTYRNPQNGAGGLPQIFIPDYSNLKLVQTIPLK